MKQSGLPIQKRLLVGGSLLLLLFVFCCTLLLGAGKSDLPEPDITAAADLPADWQPAAPIESAANGEIKIPGYGTLYFTAGELTAPVTLYNPEGNACVFRFSLFLDDADAPFYQSAEVPPGKAITSITLDAPLSPGTYRLLIRVEPFDRESGAALNGAAVKTDLVVQ